MKKVCILALVGLFLFVYGNSVNAHTISKYGASLDVDNFGRVTNFSVAGSPDLLDITKAVLAYKLTSGGPLVVTPEIGGLNWSVTSSPVLVGTEYVRTQVKYKIGGGKDFFIWIETRIASPSYYDQRFRILYTDSGTSLYDVRFLTFVDASSHFDGGTIQKTSETAGSSVWKSVNNTASTWNTQPSRWSPPGTWNAPWMATEPDFLSIAGSGCWSLGNREQLAGTIDDYQYGEAGIVWSAVQTGNLPVIPPGNVSPAASPAFARMWKLGNMTSFPHATSRKTIDVRTEAVPEPTTILLLTAGLVGLGGRRMYVKKQK